jgi:hypothetical protein
MPRNVILLRGKAREDSGIAGSAITPGSLVNVTSTGFNDNVAAGATCIPAFAREQHERDGRGIDDDIANADEVTVLYPELGAVINALTSDTVVRGDYVESDGSGGVRTYGSGFRIGQARTASDLSGTNGRVEIIIAPLGV